jgi:maltose alpha-D-glucosyltransferase/alpha-amylase
VKDDPQSWRRSLRSFVNRRRGDAMLLGEVNVGLHDVRRYFGDHGDDLHLQR